MDEKIEAVARALCRFDGRDPEQKTRQAGGRVGFQSQVGADVPDGPPLWEAYKAEAERFVVAAEALDSLKSPAPVEIKRW